MTSRHVLLAAVLSATAGSGVAAEDWPMWRGPGQNGISADKRLPLNWSATENVAWKLPMPTVSGSTPIVSGNTVFLSVAESANEGAPLALWAVDRATGTVRWKQPMGAGNHKVRKGDMTSPSPVTDGKTVWLLTGTGVLKAFDFAGKELWARDLQKDYGTWGLNHGYGSSPLLDGGALYVQVLHGMNTDDPSYVLKIDGKTGKTLWKVERPTTAQRESPDSYTTPVPVKLGKAMEIVVSGGDVVTGHDPATGKELWRLERAEPREQPVLPRRGIAGGRPATSCSRRRASSRSPRSAPAAAATSSASHKLWAFDKGPDVPSPVTDGTLLYLVDDRGVVHVLDNKTGAVVYGPQRLKPGTYSSSPVLAGDRIYVLNEDGLTTVIKSGREFQVLAENPLGEYVLGSPAASDGQLFIRTGQHLYCIGKPAAARAN